MAVRPVHWHEGMFLRPQHFQTAQRYAAHMGNLGDKWDLHYNWGLRAIDIDPVALAASRLVIRSLKARLRDGALISVPEDGQLDAVDLKGALQSDRELTIYLAVPSLQLGQANVADNGVASGTRYRLDSQPLEDENTGVNPQDIAVRVLNLKLLLSNQDRSGYETLELMRIVRSDQAEAPPQFHVEYIPPLLACDASSKLMEEILTYLYNRVRTKVDTLVEQVTSGGIAFDTVSQGAAEMFAQLRELNEAYALLATLVHAEGIHPLHAYLELCRLVGQLAIFHPSRRAPELPRYDHDDLGRGFFAIKRYLDDLFKRVRDPEYQERDFIGSGLRMQVALDGDWLEPFYQMFVGVRSRSSAEECVRLLTKQGQLDMKIGSSDRVDRIFTYGEAGLRFTHTPNPPRALPTLAGLTFFQVDRNSQKEEWQFVRHSGSLAIRMNENRVVGSIDGQKELTIRTGGQTTTMRFTLFVLRQKAPG